ncbi:MAG: glycosyltransferase family 4 protein [Muribaculaceae bacterium]|nr:glycosyltransferase family 4 protein [Muribaculaceae bacterium]
MNILFLTVGRVNSLKDRNIYSDLMRELRRRGNNIYIASPTERRFGKPTHLIREEGAEILRVRTLNIQKTNVVEKGIGTLLLERQFMKTIRKTWPDVKFDMVIYSTPPITFNSVIRSIKLRDGAKSYLMLKDIFPQNAVDLGMMKEGSVLHRMFRRKEEEMYALSDRIGCMSEANCRYVMEHNPSVDPSIVEVCPNAVEPVERPAVTPAEREKLLKSLGIPTDRRLFIYGGNLGKPQGLDFLLEVVAENEKRDDSHIVIVGDGTEYPRMKRWFDDHAPRHATLISRLPKEDYDRLVSVSDVGLIFLDPRFTIPNFPSRLLSYLENGMPVLLATDPNTDQGRLAEREEFGLWCLNGDLPAFMANMERMTPEKIRRMGDNGKRFLMDNYTVERVADIVTRDLRKGE